MNGLDYNGISLIGNVANISDIKSLPSGKKYKYFDICQNSKYKDGLGEHESKSFFSVRLFENQISEYDSIIKKGNWIHIIGKIRNYVNKDNVKKTYIVVDSLREMKPKEKIDMELFDYDWLNDPDFDNEDDYSL